MKKISTPERRAPPLPGTKKIGTAYGAGELLECLNPLAFDLPCVQKNLEYLLTKGIGTIGLSCTLQSASPLAAGIKQKVGGKLVLPSYYEGQCTSMFGSGTVQSCSNFDYPAKAASICHTKCTGENKSYISSGCNGSTIWCTCSGGVIS
jgi:hypothetical protein